MLQHKVVCRILKAGLMNLMLHFGIAWKVNIVSKIRKLEIYVSTFHLLKYSKIV